MSTADLTQDHVEYDRLLALLEEYTKKLQAFAADLPEDPALRKSRKLSAMRFFTAVKKLAQTVSQRLTFPQDYVTQLELELRLAELEMALANVNAI